MDRRKLISLLGASSLTALAGCNTARSVVRTGPPHFEDVEISGPDEVDAGEEFEVEVSATNTGGRTGDFSSTLTYGEGVFSADENVTIEDVPITETASTTIGPTYIATTGEFSFRITDYDASHIIDVTTVEAELGERVTIGDLSITATGVEIVESALVEDTFGDLEFVIPEHDVFAVVEETSSSDGDVAAYSESFTLNGRDQTSADPLPGEPSPGADQHVFDVSADFDGSAFEYRRRPGSGTDPEIAWSLSDVSAPDTAVQSILTPETAEIGSDVPVLVDVENSGSSAGVFNGILERRSADGDDDWESVTTISEEVPAGATAEIEVTRPAEQLGAYQYRVRGPETETEIQTLVIEPVPREIGEAHSFGGLWEVEVEEIYPELTKGMISGDEYSESTDVAGQDKQFAFAYVSLSIEDGESLRPQIETFSAVVDHERYDHYLPPGNDLISQPVEGSLFDGGFAATNGSESGWIVFEVPSSASANEINIQCSLEDHSDEIEQWAAMWS